MMEETNQVNANVATGNDNVPHLAHGRILSPNSSTDVFHADGVELAQIKSVVQRKIEPSWIQKRKQGGTELSYIGGHTVIRLLNEAFGYRWSFEVVDEAIVPSLGKPVTEWKNKVKVPVLNADGSQKLEAQPPVVKVLGRLTVPGYGIKEQYGSKVIIGGATEQEASFKSASTDALKKCATLFGIGLELYGDEGLSEEEARYEQTESAPVETKTTTPPENSTITTPKPTVTHSPSKPSTGAKGATTASEEKVAPQEKTWADVKDDVAKLRELKEILGVGENSQLDPFVREFMDDKEANSHSINPSNINAFNIFLTKKVPMS